MGRRGEEERIRRRPLPDPVETLTGGARSVPDLVFSAMGGERRRSELDTSPRNPWLPPTAEGDRTESDVSILVRERGLPL